MTFRPRGNRYQKTKFALSKMRMRPMKDVVGYPLALNTPVEVTAGHHKGATGRITEILFGPITKTWIDYDIQVALTGKNVKVWFRKELLRAI